jgi:hypothetical protein
MEFALKFEELPTVYTRFAELVGETVPRFGSNPQNTPSIPENSIV